MALPARRHSKQRGRKRRTHWKFQVPNLSVCPQCKALKPSHQICPFCGFYKNRVVIKIESKKEKKKKARV
jgi:large subunit ribosomal protein L32